MPSRRRTTPGIRRPRVAGLIPGSRGVAGEDGPDRGDTVVDTRARVDLDQEAPAGDRAVDATTGRADDQTHGGPIDEALDDERSPVGDDDGWEDDDADLAGRSDDAAGAEAPDAPPERRAGGRLAALRSVPVLAALLAVLLALSAFFVIGTVTLRSTPAVANTALTDVAATSEVTAQLGDAVELIYSYDFARLDENERTARDVITPAFADQFGPLFDQIREVAPQVQAIVSATVTNSAVQSLDGDRAVLVVFMDQQATTVADGRQTTSQGRLTVTGVRVDGRWKVDGVESR